MLCADTVCLGFITNLLAVVNLFVVLAVEGVEEVEEVGLVVIWLDFVVEVELMAGFLNGCLSALRGLVVVVDTLGVVKEELNLVVVFVVVVVVDLLPGWVVMVRALMNEEVGGALSFVGASFCFFESGAISSFSDSSSSSIVIGVLSLFALLYGL
jgi:hypothetical protein